MKKIIAISALMAAMASANALAADANLTFTGSVTSSTCTMNASDATKSLTIPGVSSAGLVGYGGGAWQQVNATSTISFSSCPASISNVKITSATTTGASVLPNNNTAYSPASGSATGIFLILMANNSPLATDGSALSASFPVSSGAVSIPVGVGVNAVSAVTSAAAPTAGNYSSSYTLTFSWS